MLPSEQIVRLRQSKRYWKKCSITLLFNKGVLLCLSELASLDTKSGSGYAALKLRRSVCTVVHKCHLGEGEKFTRTLRTPAHDKPDRTVDPGLLFLAPVVSFQPGRCLVRNGKGTGYDGLRRNTSSAEYDNSDSLQRPTRA